MEAAGIYFTAKNAGVPCLIIKAVSDEASAEDYSSFITRLNDDYGKLLKILVEKL